VAGCDIPPQSLWTKSAAARDLQPDLWSVFRNINFAASVS